MEIGNDGKLPVCCSVNSGPTNRGSNPAPVAGRDGAPARWTTQIPMVAADARTAITLALSPGQACDAVQGRELLGGLGPLPAPLHLIMDRAYQDNQTLPLALGFGFIPVIPPRSNRRQPWQYDQARYRKRNEIERLFRRLQGFRGSALLTALSDSRMGRIFSRFDKLDIVFLAFLNFALIAVRLCSWFDPCSPP